MNFFKINTHTLLLVSSILIVLMVLIYLIQNYSKVNSSNIHDEKPVLNIKDNTQIIKDKIIKVPLKLSYSYRELFKIKKGQTLSNFLNTFNLSLKEKNEIINLVSQEINLNKIKIDTKIEILSFDIEGVKKIQNIIVYPDKEKTVEIAFVNDQYEIKTDQVALFKSNVYKEVTVKNSIYESLSGSGVTDNAIMEFIRLFSFDIDFQREIRSENKIKIFYEVYKNKKQKIIKSGRIYFAEIKLHNDTYKLYRFNDKNDELIDYFDETGKSATKALMKTPINGARLSSGFGMRKHPILGYDKKHQGVDFAAPSGTPIMAAGTGYIEMAKVNGGAGKYIKIKHLNGYKTSYSHLKGYASKIKKGVKVNQGQTIGYVGTTGLSTGPHLHYEVWFNNKRINPMKMKLPSGIKLNDVQLKNFQKIRDEINLRINKG